MHAGHWPGSSQILTSQTTTTFFYLLRTPLRSCASISYNAMLPHMNCFITSTVLSHCGYTYISMLHHLSCIMPIASSTICHVHTFYVHTVYHFNFSQLFLLTYSCKPCIPLTCFYMHILFYLMEVSSVYFVYGGICSVSTHLLTMIWSVHKCGLIT